MTVTLTYADDLGRVRITADGLAAADSALIERSTDQINWTTVRGAAAVPVTAGVMDLTIDDYEFTPDVVNYYRVRGVESAPITFVAAGTATNGNNTNRAPALPAGIVVGDLLVVLASIRNSGTGTVNVPTGWTVQRAFGNVSLLGRRYESGDTAPTITFSGGVVGADTIAQMAAFRSAELEPVTGDDQLNGSAQNIAYPALTVPQDDLAIILAGWKQDDMTSVDTVAGFAEIGERNSTLGDDACQVWDYVIQTTAADIVAGSFVVNGGASAISRGALIALRHADYLNQQTESIVPSLDADCGANAVWLKSIARPFLNRKVAVLFQPDTTVTRASRTGVFLIVGRTLPVAVNTVRGPRQWTMFLRTTSADEADELDLMLASGDTLLVQAPAACVVETGYVTVEDVTNSRHPLRPLRRTWALPMTEVAQPGPDVTPAVGTWQTVLNTYATWADVLADNATWADLLTLIGDPSEVIVP